jgi:hypothetical protein
MSRRLTPERLHAARREATRQRLMGEGELPGQAEPLVAPPGGSGGPGRSRARRAL